MSSQNPVFIPGPTNIPDRIRQAMQIQTFDHRAPGFPEYFKPILDDTKKVLGTKTGRALTFPSSGTGGWEAAITNVLSAGDKVLAARLGVFSHRWIDLCQRQGIEVQVVECKWGAGTPAERFADILNDDKAHEIKAVLVTHNETATGVCSNVEAVRQAIDSANHPALLLVDCVSSLASIEFQMDAWGVDIAVSGSQKGFMLATGMAIVGVSQKALSAMAEAAHTRCYFDFRDMIATNDQGSYPYTPPLPLICGLRESLNMLQEEGMANVWKRHNRLANGVRAAVEAWGLRLCAASPELYSDTVSTVMLPDNVDGNALTDHANRAYGVSFGIGLGEIAGKCFRIGHLGALTDAMILSGLAVAEMALRDLGVKLELGAGVAAAQSQFMATSQMFAKEVA